MSHLTRATAQDTIEHYRASAAAFSGGDERDTWLDDLKRQAGLEDA